jgi:hypothetical protein
MSVTCHPAIAESMNKERLYIVLPAVPSSEVYLEDCVKALKRFNDNHFDLAIVDPPYGIMQLGMKITKPTRPNSYKTPPKHQAKDWDVKYHKMNIGLSYLVYLKIKLCGVEIILLIVCL